MSSTMAMWDMVAPFRSANYLQSLGKPAPFTCERCGREIPPAANPNRNTEPKRFCSELCRKRADRARYAKAVVRKRAQRRKCYAKARVLGNKGYRARFRCRLPDWAAAGQRVLDARSQWLAVNLTASQRAYARDLAIERRAK